MQEELLKNLVSELIKQFTLPIFNGLKRLTKEANNKIQVSFNLCFSEYLERNYERYSKTKTLLYREMPVNIKDFYVRTDLMISSKIVNEHNFIEEIEGSKRLIILGNAGSGKSTFCKSLFIELIEKPIGIFPIFIELRHINSSPDKSIYNFILNTMISINPLFNKEQLDYAFKLGRVLIVLDGFDEVNSEEREKIEREILHLSNNYHGIRMLISSRFDNRFSSWEEFYQYRILELDKNKALTLINKLDYDRQVKASFLSELDKKLYDSHTSFAANPLLLTMMLLTYEQIAEIPNKIHLFYEQAFLTLFNKHDSLKSMYKRKSFSQLPLDDFKRCLEAFCILSYCDRSYSFGENEINRFLDDSIAISASKTTAKDFLNDLLDSVCILQRDGLGFTFTHRSFQEYFTAQFLVNKISNKKFELFEKIFNVNWRDNVLGMVFDMNPAILEKEWIIQKSIYILSEVKSVIDEDILLLNKLYSSITTVENDDGEVLIGFGMGNPSNYAEFFLFFNKLYDSEFAEYCKENYKEKSEDNKKYEEDLIDFIINNGDISLVEYEVIDPHIIDLVNKANATDFIVRNINFLEYMVDFINKKNDKQDVDIAALILDG